MCNRSIPNSITSFTIICKRRMEGTTIFIWLVIIFIISKRFLRARTLPPGPFGLPVFGSFLNIVWVCYRNQLNLHEVFSQWATRYGNVLSFWLGNKLVISLNDVKSAKEAFMSDDIVDRPVNTTFEKAAGGSGVVFASGDVWRDQRKFSIGVFRNLGIGKSSFEKLITTEVQHLALEFKAKEDTPFRPQEFFNKATSNVISSVVLGQRFPYSDTEFNNVIKRMERNFQISGSGGALLFFPLLQYIPVISNLLNEYSSNLKKNLKFVSDIVERHKEDFDSENLRDYVDACLLEIEKRKGEGTDASALSENNLLVTILNLFAAGTDTTSTFLSWFLLYMISYPEVQQKVQQEIDAVVGRERLPEVSDKPNLPFTEAVIFEVLRIQTVVPLVPHCATRHTLIQGHRIPKGAIVVSNLWHMLHDPEVWEDPNEFKPERFLDEEGHVKAKADVVVPFGIGRRVCLGEQIAKMELFLFITHLIHQFTFELPEGSPSLSFRGSSGLTNSPHQPYKLLAISRDSIEL